MYDWPEAHAFWDTLWRKSWAILQEQGIVAQAELRRETDYPSLWLSDRLLLGQTCGWPFVSRLQEKVTPIGRFDFGLEGLKPGEYRSVFVAAAGSDPVTDLAELGAAIRQNGSVIAINAADSQSGFRVWGECFPAPFLIDPSRVVMTGSHRASVQAVARGKAGYAAIDAVTWRLARAFEPAAQEVSVIARSGSAPGLPLIISNRLARHAGSVTNALSAAIGQMASSDRALLGLAGLVPATDGDYAVLRDQPYGNLRLD